MTVLTHPGLTAAELEQISSHQNLEDVLRWGFEQPARDRCREVIADFLVHDEFTHDVLVPWKDHWLIYHAT